MLIAGCTSSPEVKHSRPEFVRPLKGEIRSSFSLTVNKAKGHTRVHHGIDIPAPMKTPVKATAGGRVILAESQRGYGKLVVIDHGGGWQSRYAHLSKYQVRIGDKVAPGEKIGLVGKTGNATGPHLHFEIRQFGEPIDPTLLIRGQG